MLRRLLPLLLAGACVDSPPPPGASWRVVLDDMDGALLCAWGTAADDVWIVGGDGGDGPMVLHSDGATWQRLDPGSRGDLWWVHGFDDGTVLMGGEAGRIFRREGSRLIAMTTPGAATVFGIWGAAPDDVWAVGGESSGDTGAFVWRFDGNDWRDVTADVPASAVTSAYFKVWGADASDVRIVGSDGVIVQWTPEGFTVPDSPTQRRLLTVHVGPNGNAAAVGGFSDAVIIEDDGGGWRDVTPGAGTPQLFGVRLTSDGGWAVGLDGAVYRRDATGWVAESTDYVTDRGFHAVWVDPDGGVWAVGGQVLVPPLDAGLLLYRGDAEVPETIE